LGDDGNNHGSSAAIAGGGNPVAAAVGAAMREESSLLQTLAKYIQSLVGPDAPIDLKVFTIVVFTSFASMSIVLTIFGLHATCGQNWPFKCNPYVYMTFIALFFFSILGSGFQLMRRAAQVEQAQRLKESMVNVRRNRRRPVPGPTLMGGAP